MRVKTHGKNYSVHLKAKETQMETQEGVFNEGGTTQVSTIFDPIYVVQTVQMRLPTTDSSVRMVRIHRCLLDTHLREEVTL